MSPTRDYQVLNNNSSASLTHAINHTQRQPLRNIPISKVLSQKSWKCREILTLEKANQAFTKFIDPTVYEHK